MSNIQPSSLWQKETGSEPGASDEGRDGDSPGARPFRARSGRGMGATLMILAAGLLVSGCAGRDVRHVATDPLERLQDGNERFYTNHAQHPHESAARRHDTTVHGQHPFATVLACSDSRVPVEILLDQGIGDVFTIRVAGNVVATDETGSIEYAVEHLGIPLVVVLGHRDCGAVTAVVKHAHELGSIPGLVAHIEPAVKVVEREHPELTGADLVAAAVEQNVWHSIEDLFKHSEAVRERVRAGKARLIGAVYDIDTARIHWLGEHPRQAEWLARPATVH